MMKNRSVIICLLTAAILTLTFMTTAYAVPVDTEVIELYEVKDTFSFSKYLPAIFGASLVIESLLIMLFSKVRRIVMVSFASLLANIASFLILRILLGLRHHILFYTGMLTHGPNMRTFALTALYFVITLVIELPIFWLSLREYTDKISRVLIAAGVANLVTTVAAAALELRLYQLHS